MRTHLSDKEYADLLMGGASPEAEAHLEVCAVCFREIAHARGVLGGAGLAAQCWSEHRRSRPEAALARGSRLLRAAAAALLLAAMIPGAFYASTGLERRQQAGARGREQAARSAEIARDNALLSAVDRELAEDVAPAMEPLVVSSQSTQDTASHSRKGAN